VGKKRTGKKRWGVVFLDLCWKKENCEKSSFFVGRQIMGPKKSMKSADPSLLKAGGTASRREKPPPERRFS